MYLIFDVGGTSTKIGIIKNGDIIEKYTIERKENLREFLSFLESEIEKNIKLHNIKGIGLSLIHI